MIKGLKDINNKTQEGKLLIFAIGRLMTTPGYTDKTAEEILEELNDLNQLAETTK